MISSVGVNIPSAINMLVSNRINVKPFISRCPFAQVDDYLERYADEPGQFMFLLVNI